MKHLFSSCSRLAAFAACALTLGSCNRSEYAMLPKTTSYHGVARVAAPVPAEPTEAAAPVAAATEAPASAPTGPVAAAPVATVLPTPPSPVNPKATPIPAKVAAPATDAATVAPTAAPRKLNLVQRLALGKITKQLRKATDLTQFKQKQNTTAIQRISGYLRTGIILLLVGILVGIFSKLAGTIIALLGVIFIVLWLLDNL